MKEEYEAQAAADGVRFNWNIFPSTRLESKQLLSPIACLFTPLNNRPSHLQPIPVIKPDPYPIKCDTCSSYINPFIRIDRINNMWWCPYCEKKSFLPDTYSLPASNASEEQWPIELQASSSTIEYVLPDDVQIATENYTLNHVFVVDSYQHVDEIEEGKKTSFENLKQNIVEAVTKLPDGSMISVITFDEHVYVHKPEQNTSVCIQGDTFKNMKAKDYFEEGSVSKVMSRLILPQAPLRRDAQKNPLTREGYLVEVSPSNRSQLINYIQSLAPKLTNSYKPPRATGMASYITSTILSKATYEGFIGKVFLFLSGPCTSSPGNIINLKVSNTLRSHKDIANLSDPEFRTALRFYETLSLVSSGLSFGIANTIVTKSSKKESDFPLGLNKPKWSIDLFSGSLDQVGIYEMKALSLHTTGDIFLYDAFDERLRQDLLERVTDKGMYNSTLTVMTSPKLKTFRLIGPGHCLPSSYQAEKYYDLHEEKISDQVTFFESSSNKKNFTNQWFFFLLQNKDTFTILFEPEVARTSNELVSHGVKEMSIQFQLKYWDPSISSWKLRITNVSRKTTLHHLDAHKVQMTNGTYKIVNSRSQIVKEKELLESFDANAFIIILSRLLLDKIDTLLGYEEFSSIIDVIDKVLIRLLHNFGGVHLNKEYSTGANPYTNLLDDLVQKYAINENFKELPSLAYNLRRNPQLIRIFNSLPDETAFYHHWFLKLDCELSKTVIQPHLYLLTRGDFKPISLDVQNVLSSPPESFVIMDTIFNIIIYKNDKSLELHHSSNSKLVYEKDPSIAEPLKFVSSLGKRPLIPKYVVTQNGHSQSRFLLARLNPAEDITSKLEQVNLKEQKGFFSRLFGTGTSSESVNSYSSLLTDDISLNTYYEGLIQAVKKFRVEDDY